jgi:hypothetical protein
VKLQRRHRVMPTYSYCRDPACAWQDSTSRIATDTEARAVAHVEATSHEVRVVTSRETILTPAKLQAVVADA